ncbi:colicin E3-like toxin immunity protein [Pseudomonas moraviensis]|uniref:colicin E3-like toxin immunity protein n=1 Tax=Pseudomonas moraviensis TaxID=321662 RepID=UPI0035AB9C07
MGLELRLEWYDTATLEFEGEESSKDLGGDESVLNALGTPAADNINNGSFNVAHRAAVFSTSNRFESSRLSNFV